MLKRADFSDDVLGHLAVLQYVTVFVRSLSGNREAARQLFDLMDAVHNTAQHIAYPDMYRGKYLDLYYMPYDWKWGNKGVHKGEPTPLMSVYKNKDNRLLHNGCYLSKLL